MAKRIQLPDGSIGEFPDNMEDSAIEAVLQKQFADQMAPPVQRPTVNMEGSPNASRVVQTGDFAKNLAIGAGKGLMSTAGRMGSIGPTGSYASAINTFNGDKPAPSPSTPAVAPKLNPNGLGQQIGYTGEQIGEFFVPIGGEGKLADVAGRLTPKLARFAVPAAKVGQEALEMGARNVSQGGDFSTGAAGGAIGYGVGKTAAAVAPKLAEVALAPGKRLLKSLPEHYSLGKTVLENTTGANLEGIADQLGTKVNEADRAQAGLLAGARDRGVTVPLFPARKIASQELGTAVTKNSPNYIKDVNKVADRLTTQYGPTGEAVGRVPDAVDPVKARALRQGIDMDIATWNPESQANIAPLQERVRGAISGGIHDAVPGSGALDRKMSELIPAKDAAWNTSYNPGITRNVFEKFARPTGALAGAGFGGYEGGKRYGTEGAVAGALLGLGLPTALASPEGQMAISRMLFHPGAQKASRGVIGSMLQLDRR